MDKIVVKTTVILYLSLACFPLMKENVNSILIIFCSLFAIYNFVKTKRKFAFKGKGFLLTFVFWIFVFHEIISLDFSTKRILLHLPFLIFPLLFLYKPSYINEKVKKQSLLVFQISVLLQSITYLFIFLKEHKLQQIFAINNYNIPFFRTFVLENASVAIHQTYFSAFLLFSFTISLFLGLKNVSKKQLLFNLVNIVFSAFFIFVLASKINLILLVVTSLTYLFLAFNKFDKKKSIQLVAVFMVIGALFFIGFKGLVKERFDEIRTEINRPLVGDYHNSINIRVAIIKCSYKLLDNLPLLGYGDALQKELNNCFKNNYDSDFYKITTYNTHNYFYNLILYGGWLFLILFLYYLYYLLRKVKYPNIVVVFIIQILIINVTENFLSRQYGIILFIYFISLFLPFKKNIEE